MTDETLTGAGTAPSAPETTQTDSNPFDTRPLHDAFRAPTAPETVNGAELNAQQRQSAGYCLQVCALIMKGLRIFLKAIPEAPGDPLLGGLKSSIGAALHTIERQNTDVQNFLQTAPPVPVTPEE